MRNQSTTLRLAALFLFVSAVLHLITPAIAGFSQETLLFAATGIVFIIIGLGLLKSLRWLAWLTFFVTLIDGIVSLNGAMTHTPIPNWVHASIMASDWLCALMLFFHLWRGKQAGTASA